MGRKSHRMVVADIDLVVDMVYGCCAAIFTVADTVADTAVDAVDTVDTVVTA